MKLEGLNSNATILRELGHRIEQLRLARNLTQAALAQEAGIGTNTLVRLEHGQTVTLDNLIRVLKVLNLGDRLDLLVPETLSNPVDEFRNRGLQRQRARAKRSSS